MFMLRILLRPSTGGILARLDIFELLPLVVSLSDLCLHLSCRGRHSLERGVDVRGPFSEPFRTFPNPFRTLSVAYLSIGTPRPFRSFRSDNLSVASGHFSVESSAPRSSFFTCSHVSLLSSCSVLLFLYFQNCIYSRLSSGRAPILFFQDPLPGMILQFLSIRKYIDLGSPASFLLKASCSGAVALTDAIPCIRCHCCRKVGSKDRAASLCAAALCDTTQYICDQQLANTKWYSLPRKPISESEVVVCERATWCADKSTEFNKTQIQYNKIT